MGNVGEFLHPLAAVLFLADAFEHLYLNLRDGLQGLFGGLLQARTYLVAGLSVVANVREGLFEPVQHLELAVEQLDGCLLLTLCVQQGELGFHFIELFCNQRRALRGFLDAVGDSLGAQVFGQTVELGDVRERLRAVDHGVQAMPARQCDDQRQ